MRYRETHYEGSKFSNEKVVATIYVLMLIAIVGMGAPHQPDRVKPGAPTFAKLTTR
jgi:hypothetical protein